LIKNDNIDKKGHNVQKVYSLRVGDQVLDAIANLEGVKQMIIKRRFGLADGKPLSYEELATFLTVHLSPQIKFEIVNKQNGIGEEVIIGVDEVKELEAQALRDLARRSKK
jgi:hypothetical protein